MAGLSLFARHMGRAKISTISRGARVLIMATKGPHIIQVPAQPKKKKPRRGDGASSVPLGEQCDGREAVTASCITLGKLRTNPSIMNILS
jgi:hypothetical protein